MVERGQNGIESYLRSLETALRHAEDPTGDNLAELRWRLWALANLCRSGLVEVLNPGKEWREL